MLLTAFNDTIRNGATMHEVREFAGHADIRTTEVYFVRREEDAEVAARRSHIRLTVRSCREAMPPEQFRQAGPGTQRNSPRRSTNRPGTSTWPTTSLHSV